MTKPKMRTLTRLASWDLPICRLPKSGLVHFLSAQYIIGMDYTQEGSLVWPLVFLRANQTMKTTADIQPFLDQVIHWAQEQAPIQAVALVGSYAACQSKQIFRY